MIASQIFSSVGIGLLIGILLGLSSSPVVGMVVGAVAALLTSLIGRIPPKQDQDQAGAEAFSLHQQKLINIRAGFFGLTCVLGIFAGLYMRTHSVLSPPEPTLKERLEELTGLGFSGPEARALLFPPLAKPGSAEENTPTATPSSPIHKTVLFSIDAKLCEQLAANNFDTFAAAIGYYRHRNLQHLEKIAEKLDRDIAEEEKKQEIMHAIVEALCEK